MDAATLPARPRAAQLLDRVFEVYFAQPLALLLFSALYVAVMFALNQWADDTAESTTGRHAATSLIVFAVYGVAAFAATRIVQAHASGEAPGLGRIAGDTAFALPRILGVYLLYALGCVLFGLLLVIPGLVFAIGAAFAVNVLAVSGTGVGSAIRRSRAITRGRWWRVFGTLLLLSLPSMLLMQFFLYLPRDAGLYWLQAGLAALLQPILFVGQAVMSFDLEERYAVTERERARRVLAQAPAAAVPPAPVYAAPSHASFDAGAFSAFEHRGWQQAAGAYQNAFATLTKQAGDSLLDAAGVEENTELLDVACGPGEVAGLGRARGAKVIGVDFSPEMLARARASHPGVEFRVADAEALPFPDRTFDAVTMAFLIGHLSHPEHAIAEARRVLRPHRRFALAWWQPFDRAVGFGIILDAVRVHGRPQVDLPEGPPMGQFSDPEALANALARAGFDDVRLSPQPMTWRPESSEAAFEAFLHATVRTAGLLREQSPEHLLAIRSEALKRFEEHRGGSGIELPMPCWIASGLRLG